MDFKIYGLCPICKDINNNKYSYHKDIDSYLCTNCGFYVTKHSLDCINYSEDKSEIELYKTIIEKRILSIKENLTYCHKVKKYIKQDILCIKCNLCKLKIKEIEDSNKKIMKYIGAD